MPGVAVLTKVIINTNARHFLSRRIAVFSYSVSCMANTRQNISDQMPRGVIMYRSKYGTTRLYAEWLADALKLEIKNLDEIDNEALRALDYVIIGSSVYIGRMLISGWIKKHEAALMRKKLFLFVVCGTPISDTEKQEAIIWANIPPPLVEKGTIFFMPGRIMMDKLSWLDRTLIRWRARFEKNPLNRNIMLGNIDNVAEKHLQVMIRTIKAFRNHNHQNNAHL